MSQSYALQPICHGHLQNQSTSNVQWIKPFMWLYQQLVQCYVPKSFSAVSGNAFRY